MKLKLTILILMLTSALIYSAEPLGKVFSVKGIVSMTDLKTKQKTVLKQGEPVFEGTLLKTEKNSRIIIELGNGIKKLLPENSELFFFTKETLDLYKKTDQTITRSFSLTGKKAANADASQSLTEKESKEIRNKFNSGQYIEVLDKLESKKVQSDQYESLYILAVCYLKLGVEKESEKLFTKLIDSGVYEYKKIAYFGLFLSYLRSGQSEKAKKIYEQFKEEGKIAEEMERLLEDTYS